jgi:hypothetical protein
MSNMYGDGNNNACDYAEGVGALCPNDAVCPANGELPGLAATMEVAGIESVAGANVGPVRIGYSRTER